MRDSKRNKKGQFLKGKSPWNIGLKRYWKAGKPIKKGQHISRKTEFKKGQPAWNKGLPAPWAKHLPQQFGKGENHYEWKGDKASYSSKHKWIKNHYGRPDTCEHCGKSGLKGNQIHWANISGKYLRVRSDWKRLCKKCHVKFGERVTI